MFIAISKEAKQELENRDWLSIPVSDEAMQKLSEANIPSDWLTKGVKDDV